MAKKPTFRDFAEGTAKPDDDKKLDPAEKRKPTPPTPRRREATQRKVAPK